MGDVPLRMHVAQLDAGGVPAWSPQMARRMEQIKAPDWWDVLPIVTWLERNGYGFGLIIVRHLHAKPPLAVALVCRLERCSPQKAKRHYRLAWDAAYDHFAGVYPGLFARRWIEEMWTARENG